VGIRRRKMKRKKRKILSLIIILIPLVTVLAGRFLPIALAIVAIIYIILAVGIPWIYGLKVVALAHFFMPLALFSTYPLPLTGFLRVLIGTFLALIVMFIFVENGYLSDGVKKGEGK
jgi:hypothetical protein